jgi:hypothetical protein
MTQLSREAGVAGSPGRAPWKPASALERVALSVQVDGLRSTLGRLWMHLVGTEDRCVFVQYFKPPAHPIELPVEVKGFVVRAMTEADRRDARVRRHEPAEVAQIAAGFVATRDERIVGAAWYTDSVNGEQPWYQVVQAHLAPPAWFDANIFVVAGEKGAAWAISKAAADSLGAAGIRSTVSVVGAHNKPSILLLRLLGAKMVARLSVQHRFGRTTTVVHAVSDQDNAVTTGRRGGAQHRGAAVQRSGRPNDA